MEDRSCEIGGHRWDLRYSARALRALQMTQGGLSEFVARLTAQSMGQGLAIETQAVLVWAGQIATEPKLTPRKVESRLRAMHPQLRHVIVAWAATECITAVLEMADAQIRTALPHTAEEDGEDE